MSVRVYVYCLICFFSVSPLIAGRYFNPTQAEKIHREGVRRGNIRIPCYQRVDKSLDCIDPQDELLMSSYDKAVQQKITHTKKIFIHISDKDYKNTNNWTIYGNSRIEL